MLVQVILANLYVAGWRKAGNKEMNNLLRSVVYFAFFRIFSMTPHLVVVSPKDAKIRIYLIT